MLYNQKNSFYASKIARAECGGGGGGGIIPTLPVNQNISISTLMSEVTTPVFLYALNYPDDFPPSILEDIFSSSPIPVLAKKFLFGTEKIFNGSVIEWISYALNTENKIFAQLEIFNTLTPMNLIRAATASCFYALCQNPDLQDAFLPNTSTAQKKRLVMDILRAFPPVPLVFRSCDGVGSLNLAKMYASTAYSSCPGSISADNPSPVGVGGYGKRGCPGIGISVGIIQHVIEQTVSQYILQPGTMTHKAARFGWDFRPASSNTILLQERQQ